MAINPIGTINKIFPSESIVQEGKTNGGGLVKFADFLSTAINEVNDLQTKAEDARNDFAIGKTDNIHSVLVAGEKANISLQYTMQVRNKVIEAYNEIMRIQI